MLRKDAECPYASARLESSAKPATVAAQDSCLGLCDGPHWPATQPSKLATLAQYAWKPLAIKDAVDAFGSVLWLDAGSTVTGPLGPAFEALHRDGHFLVQGQDMDCSKRVARTSLR